jgi:uncharacterized protein
VLKYLLVVAVVVGVLWLLAVQRRRERGRDRERASDRGAGATPAPGPRPAERGAKTAPEMVRCAHCGVHLPLPEALAAGALHYCSPEHRDAGPARPR